MDNKVNEVRKFQEKFSTELEEKADKHEMRDLNGTQVKACSQNWTLVKTIEEELTKMREKMEKNLEQGLQKISSEQLTKDVTIDMNQLVDMCNATKGTTDNLSKELSRLQKSMKASQLERKFELEALQKENNANRIHELGKLQKEQSRQGQQLLSLDQALIGKIQGVDEHLEFVHGELAKSIHIIDKHSIEIDDLISKLKQTENLKVNSKAQVEAAVDKVADLQDNLKTVQLHIASFSDKFTKLTPLTGQVEMLEAKLRSINEGLGIDNYNDDESQIKLKSIRMKSVTPTPAPRSMSPAVRNEIDELKKHATDNDTSLKRLKKSVETFKKNNESNVDSLQNHLEQSLESLTSKLSNFESRHQDNVSHLEHLKQSLRNIIGEELKNSKQVRDIENKLSNVREMLLHHDETFGEILESLSLNQLAVSALKEYLTSES